MFSWSVLLLMVGGCSGNDRGVIDASGTIEATAVTIGTEVSGKVVDVRVDEGAVVRRGDTLLVIDPTEYQLQLRQAEANQESFEAALRLSREGARSEDITQAEAAYTAAEADYRRMKELLASQTVTQKQYDDTYTRYIAAEQTFRKLKTGSRPDEITGARVRRDQAAAQADVLRKRLRDCTLLAPIDGTVTLRAVEPGELVMFGTNAFRLTDLRTVKLMIYVPEADLGRVRLGSPAQVSIDAFGSGRTFQGTVAYLSPVAEFTPKNVQTKEERTKLVFAVKLSIPNPDGLLKPGLPADARITVGDGR
jgi:HlyD family secretion protein